MIFRSLAALLFVAGAALAAAPVTVTEQIEAPSGVTAVRLSNGMVVILNFLDQPGLLQLTVLIVQPGKAQILVQGRTVREKAVRAVQRIGVVARHPEVAEYKVSQALVTIAEEQQLQQGHRVGPGWCDNAAPFK